MSLEVIPVVIFGIGGHGRHVNQLIKDINQHTAATGKTYEVLGWIDSNPNSHGSLVQDIQVLGDESWLHNHPYVSVAIGIGSPIHKRGLVRRLREQGHQHFVTLVHPTVIIGDYSSIGKGSVISAGSIISSNVRIGNFSTVNFSCTVGHDSNIDDFVTIAPGTNLSGNTNVEEAADIGVGTSAIQGVTIGAEAILGAGTVVIRDIPARVTAVGVPARVVKEHDFPTH